MGFHLGRFLVQYSTMSITSFTDGFGGNIQSFWAKNSLRRSFCVVPPSIVRENPCSSPMAMYIANSIAAGPLMVMLVVTLFRGIPSNRTSKSLSDATATPHLPTSPFDMGWSES